MESATDTTPTFVLVPGAGGEAWYWHLVVEELKRRGYHAIAVDLPAADDGADLSQYAEAIVDHAREASEVVLVAQSMGGFSAPLTCDRLPVRLLVLVNAMIPLPGETGGAWWGNTGQEEAGRAYAESERRGPSEEFDIFEIFFHDLNQELVSEMMSRGEPAQSDTPFGEPFPLDSWPDVPTRVLSGSDDRLFPADFQKRVAEDRLGITPDVIPGGHLVALSQPVVVADKLAEYWSEL